MRKNQAGKNNDSSTLAGTFQIHSGCRQQQTAAGQTKLN
jgi:hypothetical protein